MAISTEKKVGLFFLLTLIALGVLIEVVEDWNPFEKRVQYHTYFQSITGLQPGDPVRMAGVDVGKVEEIVLENGRVRVNFQVQRETLVKTDSIAGIRRTNLLGGQFLGLDFGSATSAQLPPGAQVKSVESIGIDELLGNFDRNVGRIMEEISALVQGPMTGTIVRMQSVVTKIDEGEGSLGRIINDPQVYIDLTAAIGDLRDIITRLNQGDGTLGRLIVDPTLYEEAHLTVSNLRQISDRLRNGEGTLGHLLVDDKAYVDAADALAQIREIAAKANNGDGTLGKLINNPALYDEMHAAMARVNSIAAKIDDGGGTIGRLVNEDDLYRDAKTTLHKVEKTVDGMSDSGPLSALGVVLGTLSSIFMAQESLDGRLFCARRSASRNWLGGRLTEVAGELGRSRKPYSPVLSPFCATVLSRVSQRGGFPLWRARVKRTWKRWSGAICTSLPATGGGRGRRKASPICSAFT